MSANDASVTPARVSSGRNEPQIRAWEQHTAAAKRDPHNHRRFGHARTRSWTRVSRERLQQIERGRLGEKEWKREGGSNKYFDGGLGSLARGIPCRQARFYPRKPRKRERGKPRDSCRQHCHKTRRKVDSGQGGRLIVGR